MAAVELCGHHRERAFIATVESCFLSLIYNLRRSTGRTQNAWVIPIKEEKFLRGSSNEKSGRADIILCRITEDKKTVKVQKKLQRSSIELWVVELKKEEASHENGLKQLYRYMTAIEHDTKLRSDLSGEIKSRIKHELGEEIELEHGDNDGLEVYGSLVAPSFDLISRSKEPISGLMTILKDMGRIADGFTLIDAARRRFPDVSLIKLMRLKRGDEEIIYSENILGCVRYLSAPTITSTSIRQSRPSALQMGWAGSPLQRKQLRSGTEKPRILFVVDPPTARE